MQHSPSSPLLGTSLLDTSLLNTSLATDLLATDRLATDHLATDHLATDRHTLMPIQFGLESIDAALPCHGLRRGALHEFLYHDPLDPHSLACTLPTVLAYNAHMALVSTSNGSTSWGSPLSALKCTIWIGKQSWPAPPALAAISTNEHQLVSSFFSRSIFIDPPNDSATLWAIDRALRCPAVDLIVAACPSISRATSQRLSLAAQNNNSTAILLRPYKDRSIPSCSSSRWILSTNPSTSESPSWQLSLAKLRGGLLLKGEWIVSLATPDLFARDASPLIAAPLSKSPNQDSLHDNSSLPTAAPLYKRALS
ncbi:MAG: ImuA family protein [Pseudomonadota bacterium]|jgi:hypothetical protein